jgi:hypothetical protein
VVAADAGLSQRRGSAQLMWGAIADLQHQLEEDEDLIEYKGKKNPALYPVFFPNGRSEYTQATLLTAELLLGRAATAASTHAATLGPDFAAAPYAAFQAALVAARTGTGAGDEQSAKARAEAATHR